MYFLGCGLALAFVFLLSVFPTQSADIFFYLSLGKTFLRTGSFPRIDPFLFSLPNFHWNILHEWGTFVLSSTLYSWAGWRGVILGKATVVLFAATLPLALSRKMGYRSPLTPLVVALVFYSGSLRLTERASLFSDCLTSLVVVIVISRREDKYRASKIDALLPALFLIWCNLHPGFYLGLLVMMMALVVDFPRYWWGDRAQFRRAFLIFAGIVALSILSCLCNPRGVAGFLFPLRPIIDGSWDAFRAHNFEWMPTMSSGNIRYASTKAFILLLCLCFLFTSLCLLQQAKKKSWRDLPVFEAILLCFSIYVGLSAARFMTVAALVFGNLLIYYAARLRCIPFRSYRSARFVDWGSLLALSIAILTVAFCGYASPMGSRKWGFGIDESKRPIHAAEFIERDHISGNIFNEHGFGCYLAWRWDGSRKIFFHGFVDNLDFYRRDYYSVFKSKNEMDRVVSHYDIKVFLLAASTNEKSRPLLYGYLMSDPRWKLAYGDKTAVVFIRSLSEGSNKNRKGHL